MRADLDYLRAQFCRRAPSCGLHRACPTARYFKSRFRLAYHDDVFVAPEDEILKCRQSSVAGTATSKGGRRCRAYTACLILIAHPLFARARHQAYGRPGKVSCDGARRTAFAWPFEQAHVGLRQKVRSACANERISALLGLPSVPKVSEIP